jgi:hypothetical protein
MHDEEAKLGEMMYESKKLDEKFGKEAKLNPAKKGMFAGKTKAELQKEKANLKKTGPHKRGSKEDTKMKELNFAIRAKSGWGKTDENIEEAKKAKPDYLDLDKDKNKKESMKQAAKDAQMESWEQQLNSMLTEGQSVSISLGQENMPDSVRKVL